MVMPHGSTKAILESPGVLMPWYNSQQEHTCFKGPDKRLVTLVEERT